ncbi:MAG: ATP-binding cassette domain-containing protein [Clostridiales Family XIII bacterium]|jgi:energy-coupling factor transport system ATP-binding protein|nr:ATP-binding cassette domain-containing protein [Clostridiales Family XIII bacterium]
MALTAENVRFSWPGAAVLDGFSASFERGRITAVTGPNGCGKTTLANLLVSVLKPEGGAVLLDGEPVNRMGLTEAGRRIGLVMQNPERQMFTTSVREEIEYGLRNDGLPDQEIEARRRDGLAAFGLAGLDERFPFELSGGEKQRVVLAAVTARRPEYLVLDEPTSALDRGLRRRLGGMLRRLADEDGVGVVLISHDARFVEEYADSLVRMDKAGAPGAPAAPQAQADAGCAPAPGSPLRRLDPRTKLFMMALSSALAVVSESLPFLAALLILTLAALVIGGADLLRMFARCRALFVVIAALFVIQTFLSGRGVQAGALFAAVLALRLLVVVICAQLLLEGETRDYLLALTQMRIPYEIAFMVAVGLHFLPILRSEAICVFRGMQLRGARFKRVGPLKALKAYAGLCLPIFVSTLRRADETAVAMELRGFRSGPARTQMRRLALTKKDIAVMAAWAACVFALYFAIMFRVV